MHETIRIIGGKFRGKKLHFPSVADLRPTPNRVRETLFNWLRNDIRDARCLDAFAGSGGLGFEAFSRGATEVVLLEQNPIVYANLRTVVASFNAPQLRVIKIDACKFMQQSIAQYDLVFLDPPFAKPYLLPCLNLLANTAILAPGGLVYVEAPDKPAMDSNLWLEVKSQRAGQVIYGLYKKLI